MMKNLIFDLENGGWLIHEFNLYKSKYGMSKFVNPIKNDWFKTMNNKVMYLGSTNN